MATRRRRKYLELPADLRSSSYPIESTGVGTNRAPSLTTARRFSADAAAAAGFGQFAVGAISTPTYRRRLTCHVVSVDRTVSGTPRFNEIETGKPVAKFVPDCLERRPPSPMSVRKPAVDDEDDGIDAIEKIGRVDFRRENIALHDISDWTSATTSGDTASAADDGRVVGRISYDVRAIKSRDEDDVIAAQSLRSAGFVDDNRRLVWMLSTLERSLVAHCLTVKKRLRRDRADRKTDGAVGGGRAGRTKVGVRRVWKRGAAARLGGIDLQPGPADEPFRADKVTTHVRVLFVRIIDINTAKENFVAQLFVQFRWREPALDGQTSVNYDDVDWSRYWNPNIYVENCLTTPKEFIWHTITFDDIGRATVYERRHVTGCFIENLKLNDFPFDTQDLSLILSSERTSVELELDEDVDDLSGINVSAFGKEQEWQLHGHVETRRRLATRVYESEESTHPVLSTSCRASRRPGFFIWNILLVMFFICSMAFATFSVDSKLAQNRLLLSFFLLLTTITFKFVVNQMLPRISYLTHLDKYILTSMAILCAVCVWHAVVPLMNFQDSFANTADGCALIVLGSIYFLYHVAYFFYIYFVAMRKRWYYIRKDQEYKEKLRSARKTNDELAGDTRMRTTRL